MKKVNVGIIGCGKISSAYLKNLTTLFSENVTVMAVADKVDDLAQEAAQKFSIPKACSTEALLADPDIEIAVNLTQAPVHYEVSMQILRAGKHLFTEKPLALTLEHGKAILAEAKAQNKLIAGAADTFLGAAPQTAKQLIGAGRIGTPITAISMVSVPMFHNERYHSVFRGALLDLGPYYLTALIHLLGSVQRVTGSAEIRFKTKPDGPDPDSGTFELDQASTAAAVLDFESGAVATVVATQDIHSYCPQSVIYGTHGSLKLNDANAYTGDITLNTPGQEEVIAAEDQEGFSLQGRGLGLNDMAIALREGRQPQANGALLYHLLEVMLAVYESSSSGRHVSIESRAPDSASNE